MNNTLILRGGESLARDTRTVFELLEKLQGGLLEVRLPDGSSALFGDGDDEQVKIELAKVGAEVKKLVFAVTIHEAEARKQNFGMVSNSYMRVVNNDNGAEIARFDLSEDASTETAMIFGELYRHGTEWKFKAVGQGFNGGLGALAASYGVAV